MAIESTDSDSEVHASRSSSHNKKRSPVRIVLSDGDNDDERPTQPKAAAPPALRPVTKPASASPLKASHRRSRSTSVFEGVIIHQSPKPRRPAAAKAGPSRLFKPSTPSALREEEEEDKPSAAAAAGAASDSDDEPIRPSQRARKGARASAAKGKGKKRAAPSSSSSSSSGSPSEEDEDDLPVPASIAADNARLASKREQRLQGAALRSSSGGKGAKKKRRVDTKRKLAALSQGRRDRRSADEESESDFVVGDGVVDYDTAEDEDGAPVKRRRDRKGKGRAGDEQEEEASDEPVHKPAQKKKKRAAKEKSREEVQRELLATDSEEEDVGPSKRRKKASSSASSKKKKDKKGKGKEKAPRKKRRRVRSSADGDDVDDEPDDLEILDEVTVREEKFRARQDKSSRFAQLKAAREQRAAKNKGVVLDSEDETPPPRSQLKGKGKAGGREHRPSPRYLGAAQDESSSDSDSSSVTDSSSLSGQTDLSEDLEGFIVKGGADAEGAAEVNKLRESIHEQSQGLRFYVKQYLAYLVYLILDPECDWLEVNEEWKIAHERVHTHLRDLLNSLVGSSAWKVKFKHAVDTRPDWTLDELAPEEKGKSCDACIMGRQRHSTFVATVSGPKYDAKTLRPILAEDDSSDSDSVDSFSEDEGRPPVEKTYEFSLGNSCAGRAQVYHQLRHWAYETRLRLLDKLAGLRRAVEPEKDTRGMSREEQRRERKRVGRERAEEAGRLIEVLEKGQVMGNFASKLVDEIEKARDGFANAK
ncbi:hypothetical protein JCM10449v2_004277 [Rhodotorula kratochvilovae]